MLSFGYSASCLTHNCSYFRGLKTITYQDTYTIIILRHVYFHDNRFSKAGITSSKCLTSSSQSVSVRRNFIGLAK